jgi:hypothetical protein
MADPDFYYVGADFLREVLRVMRKVEGMNLRGNIDFNNTPTGISGVVRGGAEASGNESRPEVRRVRVVEANVSTSPPIQLVKNIDPDADDVTGDSFPIRSLCKMATNDDLYVFKPTNRIGGAPTYNSEDVLWRDMRFPGVYDVALTASGGSTAANPADRTYDIKLTGYTTTISSSAQGPTWRPPGRITSDATVGMAYIDADGVPTLRLAYESQTKATC